MALVQNEEEVERVVQEGEEDLKIPGLCKRSNRVIKFVMNEEISRDFIYVSRGACDKDSGTFCDTGIL